MHANSIESRDIGLTQGIFGRREEMVLAALRSLGVATDRQVMGHLGFHDKGAVSPRITELILTGHLEECGEMLCAVTKRNVRLVRIVGRSVQLEFPTQ